ncbi:transcriptional repressor [Moraxella marmotae]|uniref:transcriptional repressor n=1 Tax=Moraxella marmotae TaxID=3344520 RepID=UPI0035F3D322
MSAAHSTHSCQHSHHHDHHHDVYHNNPHERLQQAKTYCVERGARFTPLREEVYKLILEADKPMGAYDLISALQNSRQNSDTAKKTNIAPPTVYRSLEFLLNEGLIHQLSSMNAYIPCCHPRDQHVAAFLICQDCKKVEECSTLPVNSVMDFAAHDAQFTVKNSVIELKGTCRDCHNA